MIPYGKQCIDENDIRAVVEVLKSDWLTTGPMVQVFEDGVLNLVGSRYAVAVCNGTAALHCAMYAIGVGPGDEVILPPMTFAATANAVIYQGGTPIFSDVEEDTLLIDPEKIEKKITSKTKAIIAVDYAGQPCDYQRLQKLAKKHNLKLIADGCHALGAEYNGKRVGSIADLTVFSFHPVKHITTGEGGMITTDNEIYANRMRQFRNHGITSDFRTREKEATFLYEMTDIGYNYRLSDIHSALGVSQLQKLPFFIKKRREIAHRYQDAFFASSVIQSLKVNPDSRHAWHLYVIKLVERDRTVIFRKLREKGIGVNVHYLPVYRHPYYEEKFNSSDNRCEAVERVYEKLLSLPIFPSMTDDMVSTVIREVLCACE
jgi:perosamine synthetase